MFRGICPIDTATEDGNRSPFTRQRSSVRRCIDSSSQTTHDRHPTSRQILRNLLGDEPTGWSRPSSTNNRHGNLVLRRYASAHIQQRRRIWNGFESGWIGSIKQGDCLDLEAFYDLHLAINLASDTRLRPPPHGFGQFRTATGTDQVVHRCTEHRIGSSKRVNQLEKGAIADTVNGLEREPERQGCFIHDHSRSSAGNSFPQQESPAGRISPQQKPAA